MSFIQLLERKIWIPTDIDTLWDFMSKPANLQKITPPKMGFQICNSEEITNMYAGQIITYKVKPIANLPLNWVTEISQVKEKEYFIDEQRFGPYAFWHHKHMFKPHNSGTLMVDLVHYKLPLGIIGNIGLPFVKAQLNTIFNYRTQAISTMWPGSTPL